MTGYVCPRCGNNDIKYIGYKNGKPYCRKCISLKGEEAKPFHYSGAKPVLHLDYSLSPEQKKISNQVILNYVHGVDTLINAVCGSGKTELIYGVIQYALVQKHPVAFAVPRRDVAIELFYRIKSAFPNNSVTCVYGGHTSNLNADIVVLTTHQLYRYQNYFKLIVLDEIDAFPYNGNELLTAMFLRSLSGHSVLMSATPSKEILEYYKGKNKDILELNTRFHHHPLPVPKIAIMIGPIKLMYLIKKLKEFIKDKKPVFIFAPTIEIAESLFKKIDLVLKGGNLVHSKKKDRPEIIDDFRKGKYSFLVTTAVLERGVTIKNLQVIIYDADHELYNEYNLVQIAGRVGRKYDAPEGEVIFLASKNTDAMQKAKDTILSKNKYL
ncbi:MAG: DEAD/DEAH box helicase [Bacilli bacterium]|nr:DEAD/DEAH box helicase [Bacilli bacterium]